MDAYSKNETQGIEVVVQSKQNRKHLHKLLDFSGAKDNDFNQNKCSIYSPLEMQAFLKKCKFGNSQEQNKALERSGKETGNRELAC